MFLIKISSQMRLICATVQDSPTPIYLHEEVHNMGANVVIAFFSFVLTDLFNNGQKNISKNVRKKS
jgi:hypothetical protein